MSSSPSDGGSASQVRARGNGNGNGNGSDATSDPRRPSDHADSTEQATGPALGFVGWMRWGWRQLTSMRTALVLLLLLAIAAVPGSLVPQRTADPNGVTQYFDDNPEIAPILDGMSMFDVYSSPWFSAIYLLLFISLIGCVIPRAKHHLKALRARPPRTPARLSRLADYDEVTLDLTPGADAPAAAAEAVSLAQTQLRKAGYRVERYDTPRAQSVSAERGYLRETGNLVFHLSLVGILVSVWVGSAFAYTGQRVVVEGTTFVNALSDYSSFNPGRLIDGSNLAPYAMTLDSFDVNYVDPGQPGAGQAGDFSANVTITEPGREPVERSVRVNHPIAVAGDSIFLLGNGYAPTVTIRNSEGEVVYRESQPFLPQDTLMVSLGVIKVPDGLPEQIGLTGFFYPTQAELASGAFTSSWPDLINPVLTMNVFSGDLGIDDGIPRSVYTLDTTDMEQLTGGQTGIDSIVLHPGERAELPNGWGTIEFEHEGADPARFEDSVKRFASLQVQHDVTAPWVLTFAILATAGLLTALFVPRRRMWVKAAVAEGALTIEYAGLARGEDPAIRRAVDDLATAHIAAVSATDFVVPDALPDAEPDLAADAPGESGPPSDPRRKVDT